MFKDLKQVIIVEKIKPGVGVGVMVLRDNKILLGLKNPDKVKVSTELRGEGTWTMPDGKVEFMETLVDAAKRELKGGNRFNCHFFGLIMYIR